MFGSKAPDKQEPGHEFSMPSGGADEPHTPRRHSMFAHEQQQQPQGGHLRFFNFGAAPEHDPNQPRRNSMFGRMGAATATGTEQSTNRSFLLDDEFLTDELEAHVTKMLEPKVYEAASASAASDHVSEASSMRKYTLFDIIHE